MIHAMNTKSVAKGEGSTVSMSPSATTSAPPAPSSRFSVEKVDTKKSQNTEENSSSCPESMVTGVTMQRNKNLTLFEEDFESALTAGEAASHKVHADAEIEKHKANLNTFFGVFLPCCQNIVGVIYFVRFPWIVGVGGIGEALAIVGLCNLMSITTAISMSAIATNGKVTAGGTYFMISRSLGPTFGGSVGILFFIGTSISVAMYYLGTIEVLLINIAPGLKIKSIDSEESLHNNSRIYGSALLLIMGTVVFLGVRIVKIVAFIAINFLVLSILAIFLGLFMATGDVTWPDLDKVEMICTVGDRAIKKNLAYYNDEWHCNKSGRIHAAYCNPNCQKYYDSHEVKLIKAIPGFQLRLFEENWNSQHSEQWQFPEGDVGTERDIVTDISTSFVFLFSIYFPSITGVESGSNYSGDLKDPQKSIPRGTLAAVAVTSMMYMSSVVLQGSSCEGALLRDKYGKSLGDSGVLIVSAMAWPWYGIVLIGAMTATIGAGMQALAGGPRLLQAIGEDEILPQLKWFSKRVRGEPIRALMLTFMIAETGILIAFLDFVAPIVTQFFLLCYGSINFAVTLQSLLDTPHWRPSFRYYHWIITMFGCALCITTMFLCSWWSAFVAIFILAVVYKYIQYKGAEKEWGDGITGLSMSTAIFALNKLNKDLTHTKNWRPQVLTLLKIRKIDGEINFTEAATFLLHFSNLLKGGKGLCMFGTVSQGILNKDQIEIAREIKGEISAQLADENIKGFVEVVINPSICDAISCMIQTAGIGALRPNTIILAWPTKWSQSRTITSIKSFLDILRHAGLTNKAGVILKAKTFPSQKMQVTGTIDIWWVVHDGGLMVLLAKLLSKNKSWKNTKLRIFSIASVEDNTIQIKKDLETYLYQLRLDGTVFVLEMDSTDIGTYVYERTLQMEERTRMINELHKEKSQRKGTINAYMSGKRKSITLVPPQIDDININSPRRGTIVGTKSLFKKTNVTSKDPSIVDLNTVLEKNLVTQNKKECVNISEELSESRSGHFDDCDSMNLKSMNTAVKLNALMKQNSNDAAIVIMNLPSIPETDVGQLNFMSFLEALTDGIERIVLVKGTGAEVITVYN